MDSENKSMETDCVARHCAFCLQLCGSPVKICGGCKKRAYCSKECQKADWSSKGNGQRHVNWCSRHECGEEDVDWQVVPIPDKGLGIRAKKLIPSGFKIIVERLVTSPYGHPGIKDLSSKGESLEEKFLANTFIGETMEGQKTVALRIARVNHSCQPNASSIFDETALVAILFAQGDILPGEEICISYYSSLIRLDRNPSNISVTNSQSNSGKQFECVKNATLSSFGIICPAGCLCQDPAFWALVQEGKLMHSKIMTLGQQLRTDEALAAGEKLLDIQRRLNVSLVHIGFAYVYLFRIAVCRSQTLPRAKEYMRLAAELFRNISPYSEERTKAYENLFVHPETDSCYLIIDKMMASR